jgi:elongation factor Ts
MKIDAKTVKTLRDKTGAGFMDCKKALEASGGDLAVAEEELRKSGILKAASKAMREAKEGMVESYIHPGAKLGVLVEVDCETDFVAKTEQFKELAHNIALQIAATGPLAVNRDEIPEDVIEKEKEIYKAQITGQKPDHIVEKIIGGKLDKFYQENVLLEQFFIRDQDKTIEDLIKETIASLGENIVVRRFTRFRIGED